MGWSEFHRIPNEYNEEFKAIDESILELIVQRKALLKGKRYFPPVEIMEEWASRYEMQVPQISWFMHGLNERSQPELPNEPGDLQGVLPIMKKSVLDGIEYQITHAMQHTNGSKVNVEIKRLEQEEGSGDYLRPQLLLEVTGNQEYYVRRHGSRGSGGQSTLSYLVTPSLPDNLMEVQFALVPYAQPMEDPPKELILDKEIVFE